MSSSRVTTDETADPAEALLTIRPPSGQVPPEQASWNPQRASAMPYWRYQPAHERVEVPLIDRTWPSRRVTQAPLWVPVDLRDGNQALPEPMSSARKLRAFRLLVAMGFKEIEVGYPSASTLDFDFVRLLATGDDVPDDVTLVVFTPARTDLIDRTFESIRGLSRAVVHMCTATAPQWRDVVLGHDRRSLLRLILDAGAHVLACADALPGTTTRFQFSPEVFNLTEPDYVLEVCNSVTRLWDACPDRPVIQNLPATVEFATPNVYADQIEWMDRHLERREAVILSVHPHNDRGTGVASAELAMLAGAQRVEGCLFGNGERTGNVDLVTLAMNLFSQGVDPQLDLSDIDTVRKTVEQYNRFPVPERHPYGGNLVYTAFSGTHQDAIRKGLAHHRERAAALGVPPAQGPWDVPYLPIDPADVGRDYEAVIRVTSQSGKGGVAYLMHTEHGLQLPRALQKQFAHIVQATSEATAGGGEITGDVLWELFSSEYLQRSGETQVSSWTRRIDDTGLHHVTATAHIEKECRQIAGTGLGPADAMVDALRSVGVETEIVGHHGHAVPGGRGCAVYVELRHQGATRWGVAIDSSGHDASVKAVLSALGRAQRAR